MKYVNYVSTAVCLFTLVCFGSKSCGAAEPNERDMQLAKEKVEQLKDGYKECLEAAHHLHEVVEQAKQEVPLLGAMEKAFKNNEEFRHRGLAKEWERYHQYLKNSEDPNETKKIFSSCRDAFGARELAKAIEDPNQERVLKLPMLTYFRTLMSTEPYQKSNFVKSLKASPLTFFDVNEPNDDLLWQNLKRMHLERAEGYKTRQQELIEREGVPEWLADYAGKMNFAQSAFEMYEYGLMLLMPEEVRLAEVRLLKTKRNLDKIYPRWFKMHHLLAARPGPEDEAIVQQADEHLRTWPVERTISPSELIN
jgi:hypothetical protein